jgi:acyl-coenzyme A synthetase/AMP-(fatty) acid ligase
LDRVGEAALYAVERIFHFARARPRAPAIFYNLEPVSYRDLHGRITRMRRWLSARHLPPDGVAILWIDHILAGWTVDLALRTLGLTTVSVRNPAELEGLKGLPIVALVTRAAERRTGWPADLAPAAPRIVIEPGDLAGPGTDGDLDPPPAGPSGGHILLTSATTGRPKMILIDAASEEASRNSAIDLYAQRLEPGADVATAEGRINLLYFGLWTAVGYTVPVRTWGRGGSVIIHQADRSYRSLLIPRITHVMAIHPFLTEFLAAPESELQRNEELQILVTGGALSLSLAERVKARLTPRVATMLGSTESGLWAITPIETAEDLTWHQLHPERVIQVVDEQDHPLPPGQVGRVRVLQDNGVTSYLNDPAASAAAFHDGFFYSGDLGVLDGTGRLALHGRTTDVLNIRGEKVAAGPFEDALRTALALDAVCVLSRQGLDHDEELHVVLETTRTIDEAELTRAAQSHLRGFPRARIHFMPRLPRNHMGKVDRLILEKTLFPRG